jgi:hypothetical protein
MTSFIWQGWHWKHPDFVYGCLENGRIVCITSTLNQNPAVLFLAEFMHGNSRHGTSERMSKSFTQWTCLTEIGPNTLPSNANALQACHNMNPIVNPNIQSVPDVRRNLHTKAHIPVSTYLWPRPGF